jgi:hypothetical protein
MVVARPTDFHPESSWPVALYVVLRIQKLPMEHRSPLIYRARSPLRSGPTGSGLGFQQILDIGERTVCGGRFGFAARGAAGYRFIHVAGVFVVVAIETQQLPVAAVGGVVVVVVIAVVHRECVQVRAGNSMDVIRTEAVSGNSLILSRLDPRFRGNDRLVLIFPDHGLPINVYDRNIHP